MPGLLLHLLPYLNHVGYGIEGRRRNLEAHIAAFEVSC